jgi:soluble lytic murein transglycosylase-like protein
VDPALLLSVVMQESGGNPRARSRKGALGLMQLMPETAKELGVRQPLQPDQNIMAGAQYLARLLKRFQKRLDLALAAYNAGPRRVEEAGGRIPAIRETQRYVQKVLSLYGRLRGTDGTEMASPSLAE